MDHYAHPDSPHNSLSQTTVTGVPVPKVYTDTTVLRMLHVRRREDHSLKDDIRVVKYKIKDTSKLLKTLVSI